MASHRVYLDVCALSRLFDDQVQARIRLETGAVKFVLSHMRASDPELVVSPVHLVEVAAIKNLEERESLKRMLKGIGTRSSDVMPPNRVAG
jgi:hypothetical protein